MLGIGGWRLLRAPWASRPRSAISMKATRPLRCWNARAPAWHDHEQPFDRRARGHARRQSVHHAHGRGCRLRPLRSGPDRAVSRRVCAARARHFVRRPAGAGPRRTRTTPRSRSTWPTWRCAAAARSTASAACTARSAAGFSSRCFRAGRQDEVPIGHVTNGVHMPTWDSADADRLWTEACGKDRWLGRPSDLEQRCPRRRRQRTLGTCAPRPRSALVAYVRARAGSRSWPRPGASRPRHSRPATSFDPDALTLGFARRFATYKRPNLLLHDPERLQRILTNPQRPVQLIMAGKAHPQDPAGQALIQQWIHFIAPARGARRTSCS